MTKKKHKNGTKKVTEKHQRAGKLTDSDLRRFADAATKKSLANRSEGGGTWIPAPKRTHSDD
jgi:hypothetical protein